MQARLVEAAVAMRALMDEGPAVLVAKLQASSGQAKTQPCLAESTNVSQISVALSNTRQSRRDLSRRLKSEGEEDEEGANLTYLLISHPRIGIFHNGTCALCSGVESFIISLLKSANVSGSNSNPQSGGRLVGQSGGFLSIIAHAGVTDQQTGSS